MSKLLKGFIKQIAFFSGVFSGKKSRRAGVLFYTYKKAVFCVCVAFFLFFCVGVLYWIKALVKPFFLPKRRLSKVA